MLGGMPLPPVVAEVVVPVTPTQAFVGFTAQMGEWWDPLLTPDPATFTSIEIDPEGDVATVHGDEHRVCGRVTTWEPGERYAQDVLPVDGEGPVTALDVLFSEQDGGASTRVRVEHSGWAEGSERARDTYAGWDRLLARFAAFVS
jgi:uncharacterized protein YndB with AHSA1/START domain